MSNIYDFNIFTSNRLEILVNRLSSSLETPVNDPFEKEIIVVQSRGMEKFLSLELAEKIGISANIEFLYPNSMLEYCLEKIKSDDSDILKYNVDKYAWTIIDIILEFEDNTLFDQVFSYVNENGIFSMEKLYQFSLKISELFQQYQIFRPDWILKWEKGDTEDNWQAILWKRFKEKTALEHSTGLIEKTLKHYKEDQSVLYNLPRRISVFGIFALPGIYLESLHFFSLGTEVNFYLLNPCREYWGDIISEKRKDKIEAKQKKDQNLYFTTGNQLLASLGESGKNFFDQINEYNHNIYEEDFYQPGDSDILKGIQSSVLNLENFADTKSEQVSSKDKSVRIHSCHSPVREMEVLKDNILMLLESDRDLNLGDILVMIPDIEKYSPYINSVFSGNTDGKKLSFSIADRSLKSENHAATAFINILNLFKTRFEASAVSDLLEERIIYKKFRLDEKDLLMIRDWIYGLDISWGLDQEFKKDLGLPADDTGTWKKGIDRLALGHALNPDNLIFFNELLPHTEIDGDKTEILSNFIAFFETIKFFKNKISNKNYSVLEWIDIFYEIADSFLSYEPDYELEIINLKELLRGIKSEAEETCFETKVPFSVMLERIDKTISSSSQKSGFLDGRITFCAMIPMRSIPFKMIALCGMNESDFPREYVSPDFDLIVKHRRKGDRNIRDDDRYLFLETLISARKYFYITYTGKDYKTDSVIPPSVVVSEFADYIADNFYIENTNEESIKQKITREHKAPSFSSDYFLYEDSESADLNNDYFSFSKRLMDLSMSLENDKSENICFFDEPIEIDDIDDNDIDINSLVSFFKNPQNFFLRYNNIKTGIDYSLFSDREVFYPDPLKKFFTTDEILSLSINSCSEEKIDKVLKSKNRIPFGKTGELFLDEIKTEVFKFREKIVNYLTDKAKLSLDINLNNTVLTGNIDLYDKIIFLYRYGSIKPQNILELWIKHISASVSGDFSFKGRSVFAGKNKSNTEQHMFSEIEDPAKYLSELIQIYKDGIIRPLNFHPEVSYNYFSYLYKNCKKDITRINDDLRKQALKKSENEMQNRYSFTDFSAVNKIFRGRDFLNEDFIYFSEKIFTPVFLNLEKSES